MAVSRVIEVSFGRSSVALVRIDTAYFYNNGIIFKPTDLDLPASYQVHWADSPQASSTLETIGTSEGAPIPDDLWNRSRVIYGWIYLHPTEDSGVTAYEVRIYKNVRAGLPDGTEPTPAEQSTIDQLISALNSAVEQTGEDVESASQSAQSAENAKTAAESARDTAGEYANDAESSAASASTSASQASTSATASAQSASQSAQIKADVEGMVDDAQGYASASAQSASASANSASDAQGYANSASASAQSASGYASSAQTSAQTASAKASEASTSASTASQKATEASQSASQALSYKTDAESAKTASQTAQGLAESARDTAVQAKTDVQNIADGIDTRLVDVEDALAEKAPIITDTASGSIASFSDGADDLPLKSLIVDINPIQDLHGQDAPYPAGGGKNLCSDIASDYTKPLNYWVWHRTLEDGTYYITVTPKSGAETRYTFIIAKTGDAYAEFVDTVTVLTTAGATYNRSFTVDSTWTNPVIGIYCPNGKTVSDFFANYTVQLEKNATATAYAPYENICPISGWTQVNAYNDPLHGGNIEWNQLVTLTTTGETINGLTYINNNDGSFNISGTASVKTNIVLDSIQDNYIVPNHIYALFGCPQGGGNSTFVFGIGGLSIEYGNGQIWTNPGYSRGYASFTVFANQTVNFQNVRPQIFDLTQMFGAGNEPSTIEEFRALFPNDYYPYNAGEKTTVSAVNNNPYTHININLGQTVYGGKLDVLSGELTVYPYYASYNGETLTGEWISDRDKYVSGATPTIGAQVVNIGAQGVTVQLSANQINSLYGVNNLWADSGDTEVVYRADTKLFIERLTAPDSADMIADANITSGQYFMVGNSLYKATANIANGSAIVVGTNCIRKSLSEALNEINA